MINLRIKMLGLAIISVLAWSGCSSSGSSGAGGGAGGGTGGGSGGGGGGSGECTNFTTPTDKLLNAPVATGVTVVKKTPNHPPLDGGLP